jgi:hypothetical protein
MNKIKKLYEKFIPYVVQIGVILEESDEDTILGEGTGFITGDGYLITNYHVIEKTFSNNNHKLYIRFSYFDGSICIFDKDDLTNMITGKFSQENYNDYVILNLTKSIHLSSVGCVKTGRCENCPFVQKLITLEFMNKEQIYIGQPVCFLGYPLGKKNISINTGIISSIYKNNGVTVFQIDANVNNGNSGGPLIDIKSGKIIGIITRKEDGRSDFFKHWESEIQAIINELSKKITEHDLNLAKNITKLNLHHYENLKILSEQFKRSANLGIGYAFEIDDIINDLSEL